MCDEVTIITCEHCGDSYELIDSILGVDNMPICFDKYKKEATWITEPKDCWGMQEVVHTI